MFGTWTDLNVYLTQIYTAQTLSLKNNKSHLLLYPENKVHTLLSNQLFLQYYHFLVVYESTLNAS